MLQGLRARAAKLQASGQSFCLVALQGREGCCRLFIWELRCVPGGAGPLGRSLQAFHLGAALCAWRCWAPGQVAVGFSLVSCAVCPQVLGHLAGHSGRGIDSTTGMLGVAVARGVLPLPGARDYVARKVMPFVMVSFFPGG